MKIVKMFNILFSTNYIFNWIIIFAKASKGKKSTNVAVTIFVSLLVIAMLTGAVLFIVGSIQGWFLLFLINTKEKGGKI